MSWFRFSSLMFALWGVIFTFLPARANQFGGIGYVTSKHAEDWTQIVGLFSFAFAIALHEAHGTDNAAVRRAVARAVLAFALPCGVLMTYWQLMANRRWIRFDIVDVILLFVISYGMLKMIKVASHSDNVIAEGRRFDKSGEGVGQ